MTQHPRVVRVLPEGTINKTFDYLVPDTFGDEVRVGTLVRVELNRRRVRAWVVGDGVQPPSGIALRPLAKVTGWGPAPELVDLAEWAAWRWAGRAAWFLGTASPHQAVRQLPAPAWAEARPGVPSDGEIASAARAALERPRSLIRLPPLIDPFTCIAAAVARGPALVLVPSLAQARRLARRLARAGQTVALMPEGWAAARAGVNAVIGTRSAAWAPVADLRVVVVVDEHEEVFKEEQTTTWHARDLAMERARRSGAACLLISPIPSLEAIEAVGADHVVAPSRSVERSGWPLLTIVDRRQEDPGRVGLCAPPLARYLRDGERVVCVLNRRGRARLLACASCGSIACCAGCESALIQVSEGSLSCPRCGSVRPQLCQACGATRLKNLRIGVSRAREELEAMLREPVGEITGPRSRQANDGDGSGEPETRVVVGTEAVLHQVGHADLVVFLDFDQELLAPRYRASEQALALLVRAARLLARAAHRRGRSDVTPSDRGAGRLVVQTRVPDHEVLQAALHADAGLVEVAERRRRQALRLPPYSALAAVSGPGASTFIEAVPSEVTSTGAVEILGPSDGRWLVRAADHQVLCDALQATPRPVDRVRVEVDPIRV